MNKKYTFQGIDHKKDRIYIHFDVTTICNYECTYCCNRAEFNYWQKPSKYETLLESIEKIHEFKNKYNIPIFLMFTGGEPTYTLKYFEIMNRCINLLTHPDDRLVLESNGSRTIEFYSKYPIVNKKVFHMFSIHPQYVDKSSLYDYINKLNIIQSKGYRVKVNLMMDHSEKYWNFIDLAYDELKSNNIEVHPHYIYYKSSNNQIKYNHKFWKRFERMIESTKEYELTSYNPSSEITQKLTDYQVFKYRKNHFKNWICYHNNICINIHGEISNQCFKIDKIEDILNLKKGVKCPYNSCNCDGLLKIRKESIINNQIEIVEI